MHGGFVALVATAALAVSSSAPAEIATPIRGITISTHRGGQDWGSDRMPEALAEVRALGANWIAIHPYGRISADGSIRTRYADGVDPPVHIARPIREARAAGLKILIKPHLAYWGSPFGWRGEIGFETDEAWDHFWRDYERFILQIASWTRDADGLVVGTELRRTESHEGRWRSLIEKVRRVSDVPLTYAANWDDFERVGFWDALDVIGIQAYFPLVAEDDSSESAIRVGWQRWMKELSEFARHHDKPIVFTELGYNQAYHAPVRPWDYRTDDEGARDVQERCMKIALHAIEEEPAVLGVFLWKWFLPPRRVGRNFQLATPRMQRVIQESWQD